MPIFTLDKLVPGEAGRIVRIHGRGPVRRRLVDMGLTPGAVIEMVKASPLGDPVEYRLRGYHLSLRKSEARTIEVELLHGAPSQTPGPDHSRSVIPLTKCDAGQKVEIIRTRGGRRLNKRLTSLDLKPGSILHVVQNDFLGPLIISVNNGERFSLGKGQARHILVKPC